MFGTAFGLEISWLLPAALIALVALFIGTLRAPRTDRIRAAAVLWGGWVLVTGLTFSYMSGTAHPYYAVALAPGIAALVAIGARVLWGWRDRFAARGGAGRDGAGHRRVGLRAARPGLVGARRCVGSSWWAGIVVAAALLVPLRRLGRFAAVRGGRGGPAARARQCRLGRGDGRPRAHRVDADVRTGRGSARRGSGAARWGLRGGFRGGNPGGMPPGAFPGGTNGACRARPRPRAGRTTARAGRTTARAGRATRRHGATAAATVPVPAAGRPTPQLVALLKDTDNRWAAATNGSMQAAPLQLASGKAVMAIGGFTGSDPSPTLAQFQAYVRAGDVHYYVAGGRGGGRGRRSGRRLADRAVGGRALHGDHGGLQHRLRPHRAHHRLTVPPGVVRRAAADDSRVGMGNGGPALIGSGRRRVRQSALAGRGPPAACRAAAKGSRSKMKRLYAIRPSRTVRHSAAGPLGTRVVSVS